MTHAHRPGATSLKMARYAPGLYLLHAVLWSADEHLGAAAGPDRARLLRHAHRARRSVPGGTTGLLALLVLLAAGPVGPLAAGRVRRDHHAVHDERAGAPQPAAPHPGAARGGTRCPSRSARPSAASATMPTQAEDNWTGPTRSSARACSPLVAFVILLRVDARDDAGRAAADARRGGGRAAGAAPRWAATARPAARRPARSPARSATSWRRCRRSRPPVPKSASSPTSGGSTSAAARDAGRSRGDAGAGRHHRQHGEHRHRPDHAAGRRRACATASMTVGDFVLFVAYLGYHRRFHRRPRPVPGPLPADRGRVRAHERPARRRHAGRAGGSRPRCTCAARCPPCRRRCASATDRLDLWRRAA